LLLTRKKTPMRGASGNLVAVEFVNPGLYTS
jgi:hypothetical protein